MSSKVLDEEHGEGVSVTRFSRYGIPWYQITDGEGRFAQLNAEQADLVARAIKKDLR